MAFTTPDLAELEKAIKTGTLRVKYADREVEYRSLDEMLRLRDLMRKELGLAPTGPLRWFAAHSKGLD